MNSTDMHKGIRSAITWVVVVAFVAAFSWDAFAGPGNGGSGRFSGFKSHVVPFFKPDRYKLLAAGMSQRVKGLGEGLKKMGEGFQHTFHFSKPKKSLQPKHEPERTKEPSRKSTELLDVPVEHVFERPAKPSKLSPIEAKLILVPGVLDQIKSGTTGVVHTVQKKLGEVGHKIVGTSERPLTSKAGTTTNNSLARAFGKKGSNVEGDKTTRKPVVEDLNSEIPTISAVTANANTMSDAKTEQVSSGDEFEPKIRETYRRVGLANAISNVNWMLKNKMKIIGVDAAKPLGERVIARATP